MTPTIFSHPDRQMPKFRPFKAFAHFRKLIKDKEDTEQVFTSSRICRARASWTTRMLSSKAISARS